MLIVAPHQRFSVLNLDIINVDRKQVNRHRIGAHAAIEHSGPGAGFSELQPKFLECFEWKEQSARHRGETPEAIALVEGEGVVVLGIDNDRVNGNHRACVHNPADRVEQ